MGAGAGPGGMASATPLEPPPAETAAVGRAPQAAVAGGGLAGSTTAGMHRIHFDFDQATLTPAAREILGKNANYLRDHVSTRIRIEGHCDERGTTEYNLGLGERRAKTAFQYLMDLGIDPNRMTVVSYGEEVPLDPGHNEEAWAQNRRAEFVEILQ
ncbi:MAG: peptidoglycan-associated lipoprotein Pal [Deltaproteobacteria bacterium]|nr:peptidoglycan-associated lipoprotein Pal [Deltaproteobacteria bacterium]